MPRRSLLHATTVAAALSTGVYAVPVVLPASGCLADCTEDGCESHLGIVVREPDGAAVAPGLWDFEFVADGVTLVAACEIDPGSHSSACEPGDVGVTAVITGGPDNPIRWLQIDLAIGDSEDGLPKIVDVTILHNGTAVVEEHLEPDYERVEPKHCDADCVADDFELLVARD